MNLGCPTVCSFLPGLMGYVKRLAETVRQLGTMAGRPNLSQPNPGSMCRWDNLQFLVIILRSCIAATTRRTRTTPRRPTAGRRRSSRYCDDMSQGCQMAKFDPFLSCPHALNPGAIQGKEGNQILQRSGAEPQSFKPKGPNANNLEVWLSTIWQP